MTGEISITEAAKHLAITVQAVGLWAKRKDAPARADGRRMLVQWPQFARWREAELMRQAVDELTGGDYEKERTRKIAAEASLAELDLAKARGEFVSIEDYETALGRTLDILMARLRALPVRLAHHGDAVEASAEQEVERIITELSQFDEDIFPDDEPNPEAAATV